MLGIDNNEIVTVEGFIGSDPHRISTTRRIGDNVLVVHTHVDLSVVIPKGNQLVVERRAFIHVIDVT